jgi:GDP-L-fucose synthase
MKPRLFIAGHCGMVGAALLRHLHSSEEWEPILATRSTLNLCDTAATHHFIKEQKPDTIIIAAAKVGGIHANNTFPADFLYDNLMIAANIIHSSFQLGVKRLLFLGSSCIYPKFAPQPMPEECLLTSALEPTNEAYGIAKIAGLKLCAAYRKQYGTLFHSAMPTNLYGPGDNYHPENSHVIPAMIGRFHAAKENNSPEVTIWGTGTPRREFLHVEDLADACFHLLKLPNPPDWVNVGWGDDQSILELAHVVAETVGYQGKIVTDPSKPDGPPRKLLDTSLLKSTGWNPRICLKDGLKTAYADFLTKKTEHTLRQ